MIDIAKLQDIEVDNVDMSDYPDFCDAYISAARIEGRNLTEEELEEINNNSEFVYEKVVESIF